MKKAHSPLLALACLALSGAPTLLADGSKEPIDSRIPYSPDQVQKENARIYLNALPEIQKKLLQSKFEKIRYNKTPMVELFSPRNANEVTDPLVVFISGDNKAPLENFPELIRPIHKLMKSHLGVYFFKGYYADDSSVRDKDLDTHLYNALVRIRSQNRERQLHLFAYGKGKDLMQSALKKMEGKESIHAEAVSEPAVEMLYPLVAARFDIPKTKPDRRAKYRCCLSACQGGPNGGNHDLEIGWFLRPIKTFSGVQYPAFINAFGAASETLKFDSGLVSRIEPQKNDPNYYYFTFSKAHLASTLASKAVTGYEGDHLMILNMASPREAFIWKNYALEMNSYKKPVSQPIPLTCEMVKNN